MKAHAREEPADEGGNVRAHEDAAAVLRNPDVGRRAFETTLSVWSRGSGDPPLACAVTQAKTYL